MLILEQFVGNQPSEGEEAQNSTGTLLLAMAQLLYERGDSNKAIEKLDEVLKLTQPSSAVKAAAYEGLCGLYLRRAKDDDATKVADGFLKLSSGSGFEDLVPRARAMKGLVELVNGNLSSAESFFIGHDDDFKGNAALSYGECLHATQNFSLAKEVYEKVIKEEHANVDFSNINTLAVCNMVPNDVQLAAHFALGQLEAHMGNFGDAEEILTKVLVKTEELFGPTHLKVGLVLTYMAVMFRNKARQEGSSSLLIQEGLYRRAIDYLKPPPLEDLQVADTVALDTRDIAALARGGYAEVLCIQENRKKEGEKLKNWADSAWRNRRMSLAAALDFTESPIIDGRVIRVL